MTEEPLQPISSPSAVLSHLGLSSFNLPLGTITEWVLFAAFAFWALYTLIAIYHWLKYSHASWVAFPAIAIHLFVSFSLISYALSGTGFFTAYLP